VLFLGTIGEEARRVILKLSEDPTRTYLEKLDQTADAVPRDTKTSPDADAAANAFEPVARVNQAVKALDVLGQILKNFPGSLTAQKKLDIALSCCRLGLRTMGYCLGLIRDSHRSIITEIAETLERERHIIRPGSRMPAPKADAIAELVSSEEVEQEAASFVVRIAKLISFGVIRRTGNAIAGRDLERTQAKTLKELPGMAPRLIDFSVKTEQASEGDVLATQLSDGRSEGRRRDGPCPRGLGPPPAQIPACRTTALGSAIPRPG